MYGVDERVTQQAALATTHPLQLLGRSVQEPLGLAQPGAQERHVNLPPAFLYHLCQGSLALIRLGQVCRDGDDLLPGASELGERLFSGSEPAGVLRDDGNVGALEEEAFGSGIA